MPENVNIMTLDDYATIEVHPVDANGDPAPVENLRWSSSDSTTLMVTPDPDNPNKVKVDPLRVADAQIIAEADPILGAEEGLITEVYSFSVRPEQAVSLGGSVKVEKKPLV